MSLPQNNFVITFNCPPTLTAPVETKLTKCYVDAWLATAQDGETEFPGHWIFNLSEAVGEPVESTANFSAPLRVRLGN